MGNIEKNNKLKTMAGLKVTALLFIFWWHSNIPRPSVNLGARACEFFFIVSGFLVMYNAYNKQQSETTWKQSIQYLLRKIEKMYPLHVLTFIVAFVLKFKGFSISVFISAVVNLLCIQSWCSNQAVSMAFNGLSWYLSALLFCYFMTPFLIRVLKIGGVKSSGLLLALFALIHIGIEFVSNNYPEVFYLDTHTNPIIRCIEFIMGMLVAIIYFKFNEIKANKVIFSIVETVTIVVTVGVIIVSNNVLYKGIYCLLFCLLIVVFAYESGIISKFFSNKIFMLFSQIQYEFYMLHTVVNIAINIIIEKCSLSIHWSIISSISFFSTVIVSNIYKMISSKYIDTYINKIVKNAFLVKYKKWKKSK